MTVGTFVQPDFESQSGTTYKTSIDNSIKVISRIGDAFAPHEEDTPAMTVRLDAGGLFVNGSVVEKAAQSTGTITAPTTNPRIDRVVIDSTTGAVSVITGVEGADPTAPDITTGYLPICYVTLATSTTAITNTLIVDERIGGSGNNSEIPIGGIYFNTGTDPATQLGYGTWFLIAASDVLATSFYPSSYSSSTVQATSVYGTGYEAHRAIDPSLSLDGDPYQNSWLSEVGYTTNLRFHIDLGVETMIDRLAYVNYHSSLSATNIGINSFTLQGSNTIGDFNDLTYANDGSWVNLTTDQDHFDINPGDTESYYINISDNITAYRYYALKIASNWGNSNYMGLRRLTFQFVPRQWVRIA